MDHLLLRFELVTRSYNDTGTHLKKKIMADQLDHKIGKIPITKK